MVPRSLPGDPAPGTGTNGVAVRWTDHWGISCAPSRSVCLLSCPPR